MAFASLLAASGAAAATAALRRRAAAAAVRSLSSSTETPGAEAAAAILAAADSEQRAMMAERIIVVDEQDKVLRPGSKEETHIWESISKDGILHRAFSVFLIDPEGKLLVQQRSPAKVTFPDYWANTCCSHPWHTEEEMELQNAMGVKRAARRKLEQELGINPEEVPLDCFTFLTRVHYEAPCDDLVWGEHEVDHVLIATPSKRPALNVNDNEVQAVKWLTPQELADWLAAVDETSGPIPGIVAEEAVVTPNPPTAPCHDKVSPWFRIISQAHLQTWWQAVSKDMAEGIAPSSSMGRLQALVEPNTIHRASDWSNTTTSAE